MQAVVSKIASAGDRRFVLDRGLALGANPRVEFVGRIDRHAQQHLGVLGPAVLRALAEKDARSMRIEPQVVHSVRNQVDFAGELRNPEAVVGVGGQQLQERRSRVVTDRSPERAARWP